MKTLLLKWWLFLCALGAVSAMAYYINFHQVLLEKDPTRISLVIIALFIFTTLWIGKKIYTTKGKSTKEIIDDFSIGWFIAESCLVLGLIGTVSGFIIMLGTAFVDIDVSNVDSMQKALAQMSVGMSASLYTTLLGLISSLAIKLQLVNVERTIEQL